RAAADLDKSRAKEPEPIVREYVRIGEDGRATGKPMPSHHTVTAEQASDDLKYIRDQERQYAAQVDDLGTAIQADALRSGLTPEQYVDQLQAQAQPQAQPEVQPQPEADLPGVDPEIADALQRSPELRAALEQEAYRVNAIQQQAIQAET